MNNTIILDECLSEFKEQNNLESLKNDEIFESFTSLLITKESDTSYEEIEKSLTDGGLDGGIDTFMILVNDRCISTLDELDDIKFIKDKTVSKVYISQAKTEKSFKEQTLDKLHISLPLILDLNLEEKELLTRFNPDLVEKVLLFRKVWMSSVRKSTELHIRLTYSTRANEISINGAFKSKIDQIINLTKQTIPSADISFTNYSSQELLELYQKPTVTTLELIFKESPVPIPFTKEEYGYIGVVTLKDYFHFLNDEEGNIREEIFENNIRHYQGEVDVNKNIAKTLKTDFSRDFWWLNNGITVIASKCSPIPKALYLDDVQIVNGLQSSYTIHKHYSDNGFDEKDNRSILIKVILSQNKETIDKIISASNSQNYIPPALLRATDDIQRKLEASFLTKGYYYDRRKNYYKNQNKPVGRIFGIQYTAQAIHAILNFSPSEARAKPTSLVKEKKSYKSIFDNNRSFDAYLNCCILCRQVNDFIKTINVNETKSIAKNFSYHIARVAAALLTTKVYYEDNDIKNIDIEFTNDNILPNALGIITLFISNYGENNPGENIINMAKSTKFSHELNRHLETIELEIPEMIR